MDDETIERIKRGDQDAFRALIDEYARLAWRTAWVLLRDRDLAEDALQDAWLNVWRGLPKFRAHHALRPWLLTIVANSCRSVLRRQMRSAPLDEAREDAREGSEDVAATYLQREQDAAVRQALAHLPPEQRATVELRFFAELDLAEIATLTQVPLGTVKSRLRRALEALRGRLSDHPTREELRHE
jgi:RNA polymerase sigma factor (sigma-70 family)